MSKRPKEQALPDSSNESGNETSQHRVHSNPTPTRQYGPPSIAATPTSTSATLQHQSTGNGRVMELPPLPRAPSFSGGSFSPASRSAGMSSILNPAEPDEVPGRRRKVSRLDSPSSVTSFLPPMAPSTQASPGNSSAGTTASMHVMGATGDRPSRKILTPRSPSLHRAVSHGHLNPPSGTLSAYQIPFPVSPRSRAYAIEPGTAGAPPLPTPSTAFRPSHTFSAPTPPNVASRRASLGAPRVMRPTSESTSPRSSYSSYSHAGQASPVAQAVTTSTPTLPAAYPDPSVGGSGSGSASAPTSVGPDRHRPVGVPIASSGGQNVFQMLTIETTSGTVQLPVDVQAASRVADEKRRRNAGASARFRQRRKEKEKEASTTIARLEQQVKELGEDADFYKHERDSLVGVLLAIPGGERHFPRPQSPRLRRNTSLAGHATGGSAGYITVQDSAAPSPDEARRVRRRTSTLSLPPPSQAQTQMPAPGQSYQPGFAPSPYGHPLAPQPPLPSSHQTGASLPSPLSRGSLPPPLMQAAPQTGPWNPYADRRPPGGPGQSRENR